MKTILFYNKVLLTIFGIIGLCLTYGYYLLMINFPNVFAVIIPILFFNRFLYGLIQAYKKTKREAYDSK